jgi:hypothetical protein
MKCVIDIYIYFYAFFYEVYALYLLSFDLSNEVFLTTLMRLENDSLDIEFAESGLTMLNEFVALILNYTQVNTFHISILGEIDVKKIMDYSSLFVISILC